MKNKLILATLCVVILLLAGNTYRLQRALTKQRAMSEQQTDLLDSLQKQIELRRAEAETMSDQAQIILERMQRKADSLRFIDKTQPKK